MTPGGLSAIVLAGGRASRLGGLSKAELRLDGVPLLDRALAATSAAGAAITVVVGPARLARAGAVAVQEDPPHSGPVAGIAAGLAETDRRAIAAEWVLVLPCDLPRANEATALLIAALNRTASAQDGAQHDGAHLVDRDGRAQWLTGVYRRRALTDALMRLGDPRGASMRALVGPLRVVPVPDPCESGADVDTWADVERELSGAEPGLPPDRGGQ